MSSLTFFAVLCGLALGVGLWFLVSMVPRLSRPTLALRVAPYVVDLSSDARDILDRRPVNPLPVFGMLLGPMLGRTRRLLDLVVGGVDVTERRLRQAALPLTVEAFRARQLVWAAIAGCLGVLAAAAVQWARPIPAAAHVALVLLAAAGGFLGRDAVLQRQASARGQRMAAELPTVLEFLTLSLSAGEGILDALRRVSRISRGELASELATVTTAVASGLPLAETLTALARTLEIPALTRATEQLVGALERGTPLSDVLRAQAQDSRVESRRNLLESAGKKEVAMLVPLVFLILPLTILFAVFPAIFVLQVGL
ncbi:tight adherence protein C [Glaciihabitans tibetensis]|uniref:Tight adherence protein C n=1 Tax=Glaciihabitans tibetensis TaxID=1266600 RepID=A0A2T0VGZ7_9MICO|nr:type II secretion system F family protein [Glaciihabitans tibetensis]PRY69496.1 tight adherence protein C [Glaciihabitans tibetensis]